RESSIARAVDAMSDSGDIYRRNVQKLRALGIDGLRAALARGSPRRMGLAARSAILCRSHGGNGMIGKTSPADSHRATRTQRSDASAASRRRDAALARQTPLGERTTTPAKPARGPSSDPELLRRLLRAKDRMDAASHE